MQDHGDLVEAIEAFSAEADLFLDTIYLAAHLAIKVFMVLPRDGSAEYTRKLALASLALAIKMREKDDGDSRLDSRDEEDSKILTVKHIKRAAQSEAKHEEIEILQHFQWNLCEVTLYDWVRSFINTGIVLENDLIISEIDPCEKSQLSYSNQSLESVSSTKNKYQFYCRYGAEERPVKVFVRDLDPSKAKDLQRQIEMDCVILTSIVFRFMSLEWKCLFKLAFFIILLARSMAGLSEAK